MYRYRKIVSVSGVLVDDADFLANSIDGAKLALYKALNKVKMMYPSCPADAQLYKVDESGTPRLCYSLPVKQ